MRLPFKKGISQEELYDLSLTLKSTANKYLRRARELTKQYRALKKDLEKKIKENPNSPIVRSEARRALYLARSAVKFYEEYNTLLMLADEIKNFVIRSEALSQLKEEGFINILKKKLSPSLREKVKDAMTINDLINRIVEGVEEMRLTADLGVSDDEIDEFIKSLATGTKSETVSNLEKQLETLEKQLEMI